jgi:hypothetical protein
LIAAGDLHLQHVPQELDGSKLAFYSPIDRRHRATAACKHVVAGAVQAPFAILAIGHQTDGSFILFYCNEDWDVITDTWHETLADAKKQAEYEYEGVSATWIACR